jgi:hypothetical protein
MTRRLGRLARFHARVVLLMTGFFGSVIDRGTQARFFGVAARALGLVQCFFFRACGIAARVKVVLARHQLGRIAVGCVLARVLRPFAVPELCGERIVRSGDR